MAIKIRGYVIKWLEKIWQTVTRFMSIIIWVIGLVLIVGMDLYLHANCISLDSIISVDAAIITALATIQLAWFAKTTIEQEKNKTAKTERALMFYASASNMQHERRAIITLKNFGKTPAINVVIESEIKILDKLPGSCIYVPPQLGDIHINEITLAPGQDIDIKLDLDRDKKFDELKWNQSLGVPEKILYIIVQITYETIFDSGLHKTSFAIFYHPEKNPKDGIPPKLDKNYNEFF